MRRVSKPKRPSFLPLSKNEKLLARVGAINAAASKSVRKYSPRFDDPSTRKALDLASRAIARTQMAIENPEFADLLSKRKRKPPAGR